MQISYENNIDQWIASQIFLAQRNTNLKKFERKNFIKLLGYLVMLDGIVLYTNGTGTFFWLFTFFLIIFILNILFQRSSLKQKFAFQQLQAAYGPEFEKEEDKTVVWDVGSEQIIIQSSGIESKLHWNSIKKVTVCPRFLFIHFGTVGSANLPKECIPDAEYRAFCDSLVQTYQQHSAEHGKTAEIVQSDWTIDLEKLKKKALSKSSLKKAIFTGLWSIIFLSIGFLFSGLIAVAVCFFVGMTDIPPSEAGSTFSFLARSLLIGPATLCLLGLILGLYEKLPGTKTLSQGAKGEGDELSEQVSKVKGFGDGNPGLSDKKREDAVKPRSG